MKRWRVAFPANDGSGNIKWCCPTPYPILTRDLVYTGITRARN